MENRRIRQPERAHAEHWCCARFNEEVAANEKRLLERRALAAQENARLAILPTE